MMIECGAEFVARLEKIVEKYQTSGEDIAKHSPVLRDIEHAIESYEGRVGQQIIRNLNRGRR